MEFKPKQMPEFKIFRIRYGLTQKQIAELSGLPLRVIQLWESRRRKPTIAEMLRLQEALKPILHNLWSQYPPDDVQEIERIKKEQEKKRLERDKRWQKKFLKDLEARRRAREKELLRE